MPCTHPTTASTDSTIATDPTIATDANIATFSTEELLNHCIFGSDVCSTHFFGWILAHGILPTLRIILRGCWKSKRRYVVDGGDFGCHTEKLTAGLFVNATTYIAARVWCSVFTQCRPGDTCYDRDAPAIFGGSSIQIFVLVLFVSHPDPDFVKACHCNSMA